MQTALEEGPSMRLFCSRHDPVAPGAAPGPAAIGAGDLSRLRTISA